MPVRIYAKHEPYDDGHLGEVLNDMEVAGQPTIRVMKFNSLYCAIEGSHRLAAAYYNDLEPKIVVEIADIPTSSEIESYFMSLIKRLPYYDFPHVHILNLEQFNNMTHELEILKWENEGGK